MARKRRTRGGGKGPARQGTGGGRRRAPSSSTAGQAPRRTRVPRSRNAVLAALGALTVALVVAGTLWWRRGEPAEGGAGGRIALPPPTAPLAVADGPTPADFVGAEACAECHQAQYRAWRGSTHGRAGGAPGPDLLIAPFDGRPIRFSDATVTPVRTDGGGYAFRVAQEGRPEQVFRVDGVIGGGHMVGGGTQGFITRFPDGTLRFLPFDWSRDERTWFCNTASRTNRGWQPITPEMRLADCGDWPPLRVLGSDSRFVNCQECHGSQIRLAFDADARRYDNGYTSLAINCESCHGPGREHIEIVRSGRNRETPDIGMTPLATLSVDASIGVCMRCHTLKHPLEPGDLPGRPLEEHYSLKLPMLGERVYFPDFRTRTFAYQDGHLASACYLAGTMTCVDCHEPHGQGYRDVTGRALASRFDDGQCLACHPSKEPVQDHTFHPPESAGSRCVACHMPFLQHPLLGDAVRFARSDHTIPIPRPAFDAALGLESACVQCHAERSPAELQRQVEQWWGPIKPHPEAVTRLMAADTARELGRAAELLLQPRANHPMAQFAGVTRLLLRFLAPDMPALEPRAVERLQALAGEEDDDVAAIALAALHFSRGNDPGVRRFLAERLRDLGSREAAVRKRWAAALGLLGDAYRMRGNNVEAVVTYRKALEITPDAPALLLNLGTAYAAVGDLDAAIAQYERVLSIDPRRPLVYVNLGVALARRGDEAGALAAYRRALEINPHEPIAYLSLGNAHLRVNRVGEAARAYEQAVEIDPSLVQAQRYLAQARVMLGDPAGALDAAQRVLEFQPEDAEVRAFIEELKRTLADARKP